MPKTKGIICVEVSLDSHFRGKTQEGYVIWKFFPVLIELPSFKKVLLFLQKTFNVDRIQPICISVQSQLLRNVDSEKLALKVNNGY
jgi:hypothetical protein